MSISDSIKSIYTRAVRGDGWYNAITGLGSALKEKAAATSFERNFSLTDGELEALFNDNDLAETIVSALPEDALREGIEVQSDKEGDDERRKKLAQRCDQLDAVNAMCMAAVMGRLFGGAGIWPIVDDGFDMSQPLSPDRVGNITQLVVLDKRQMQVEKRYETAKLGKLGEPELFRVTLTGSGYVGSTSPLVHESRIILFGGPKTSRLRKQELQGWDRSALQAPYDVLRQTGASFAGVMQLMADMSQAVWRVRGLMEMMAAGGEEVVRQRISVIEMARSLFNAVILDANGEEFDRKATPVTGVAELLDKGWVRLSAAARMPMTRLFRISPGGLNATGASDRDFWLDEVGAYQRQELRPRANRLLMLIARSIGEKEPERFHCCFPPLSRPTPKEQAEIELATAKRDEIYEKMGALMAPQIALSRFGSGSYSREQKVDVVWLEKHLQRMQKERDAMPAIPPAPTPGGDPALEDGEEKPKAKALPAPAK